jgi:hypothetical protein
MPVNDAVIANQAKIAMATATVAERRCLVGRKLIMSANGLGQAKAKLDPIFMSLERSAALSSPLICCLFDIDRSPVYAEPMPREPLPPVGQLIDQNFADVVRQATLLNPAVHDGAIMSSIDRSFSCRITGWSYRLFPPPAASDVPPNRGSAFNSCYAMSLVDGVVAIYLVSRSLALRFEKGLIREL